MRRKQRPKGVRPEGLSTKVCSNGGKRCYPSRKAALRANQTVHNRFRAYFCDNCKSWHITSEMRGREELSGTKVIKERREARERRGRQR